MKYNSAYCGRNKPSIRANVLFPLLFFSGGIQSYSRLLNKFFGQLFIAVRFVQEKLTIAELRKYLPHSAQIVLRSRGQL